MGCKMAEFYGPPFGIVKKRVNGGRAVGRLEKPGCHPQGVLLGVSMAGTFSL